MDFSSFHKTVRSGTILRKFVETNEGAWWMTDFVSISEAAAESVYSHDHIKYLVRAGKIDGRKSGSVWLVSLESLRAYEKRMLELGPQKFDPTRSNLTA
jgi:hypothetical protein